MLLELVMLVLKRLKIILQYRWYVFVTIFLLIFSASLKDYHLEDEIKMEGYVKYVVVNEYNYAIYIDDYFLIVNQEYEIGDYLVIDAQLKDNTSSFDYNFYLLTNDLKGPYEIKEVKKLDKAFIYYVIKKKYLIILTVLSIKDF